MNQRCGHWQVVMQFEHHIIYIVWCFEVLRLVLAGQQEPELVQERKVYRTRRAAGGFR